MTPQALDGARRGRFDTVDALRTRSFLLLWCVARARAPQPWLQGRTAPTPHKQHPAKPHAPDPTDQTVVPFRKAQLARAEKVLVIAACHENVAAMPSYQHALAQRWPVFVYDKCLARGQSNANLAAVRAVGGDVVPMENTGDECVVYAKFIADFYDDLPKRIAFLQADHGNLHDEHAAHAGWFRFEEVWSASDRVGFVHLNSYFQSSETTGASTWGGRIDTCGWRYHNEAVMLSEGRAPVASDVRTCRVADRRKDSNCSALDAARPPEFLTKRPWWAMYAGAQFVVSRGTVRAVPRTHFARLVTRLKDPARAECEPVEKPEKHIRVGRWDCTILERTWHVLLGEPAYMPHPQIYDCLRFPLDLAGKPCAIQKDNKYHGCSMCNAKLGKKCLPYFEPNTNKTAEDAPSRHAVARQRRRDWARRPRECG